MIEPSKLSHRIFNQVASAPAPKNTKQLLEVSNTHPTTKSVISRISMSVASSQFIVVNKKSKEDVGNSPILDLLLRGNEYMDGVSVIQLVQTHLDMVGECFIIKEKNNAGGVIGLWPVSPHWVTDIPLPGNDSVYKVSNAGINQDIPKEDMIYLRHLDISDPYKRGIGFGNSLSQEIQSDENASTHVNSFFHNRAVPDHVISIEDDNPSPEQAKALSDNLRRMFRGPEKAWRTLVTSAKLKINQLSHSFSDMKMVELRQFNRDTILQTFGIPPELLGILQNSNRATIEASEFLFNKFVIEPRLKFIVAGLNRRLVNENFASLNQELSFISPVKSDKLFSLEVLKASPYAFTANEIRELAKVPDREDGEVFFHDFNKIVVDSLGVTPEPTKSIKSITKAPSENQVDWIVSTVNQQDVWEDVQKALAIMIEEFGEEQIALSGAELEFTLTDTIREFIRDFGVSRVSGIDNTTKSLLKDIISEAIADGESVEGIAASIRNSFIGMKTNRSRLIARTEGVRSANFGAVQGMKQAGITKKEWIATMDGHVRDVHAALDGQRVGVDEKFDIGGLQADFPGNFGIASEDINCRCTVLSVFDDKMPKENRIQYWKSIDRKIRSKERILIKLINDVFDKQEQAILRRLKDA